jgi:hypothetical protein
MSESMDIAFLIYFRLSSNLLAPNEETAPRYNG